jgi:hypothetical protein
MDNGSNIAWIILLVGLLWLAVLIYVFVQIFKRDDLSLIAKLFWIFIILSFPVLGLIVYFLLGKKSI